MITGYSTVLPRRNGVMLTVTHIDEDVLESYVMGTMSPPDIEIVEEHLLGCAGCQDRLESVDAWISSISVAAAELRGVQGRFASATGL